MSKVQMKIGFEIGPHQTPWQHPDLPLFAGTHFPLYREQALIADEAKIDFVFIADNVEANVNSPPTRMNRYEPVALMGALASVTKWVGIAGTVSTTFTEPFNLARHILAVDHISEGRAGWNLVTTDPKGAADNFGGGRETPHGERYKIAEEYLDVVEGLWDSYDDDAFVHDKARSIFVDRNKVHPINHKGEYYSVKGPINAHRSAQGRPVVFTATASAEGKSFAGRRADAVFTFGVGIPECRALTRDIKEIAVAAGRDASDVVILPNATPYIGRTREEAMALVAKKVEILGVREALKALNRFFVGYDVATLDLDQPFPIEWLEANLDGFKSEITRMLDYVRKNKSTARQFALHFGIDYGLHHFVGTPEDIADTMQDWFEQGACDGFIVGEAIPGHFRLFADTVMPILRKRGLFRTEYAGTTLRENLGLKRPSRRDLRK